MFRLSGTGAGAGGACTARPRLCNIPEISALIAMIQVSTDTISDADWTGLAAGFRDHNLLQSWAYGAARAETSAWRIERCVLMDGGDVAAVAQVMLRDLPVVGGGLAWINRGPLWRQRDSETPGDRLVSVLRALKHHYAVKRGLYLRIAAPVVDDDAMVSRLGEAGFRDTGTPGWASAVVDLTRPEDELRSALRANWRNKLKQAEKSPIQVVQGTGGAEFEGFLHEYEEFIGNRNFSTSVSPRFVEKLQHFLPPDRKMVCYSGTCDGAALGSVLMVRHGDSAEYLAGTLLDAGRKLKIGQLLLWRAMCNAKEAGVTQLDLGGMDPQSTPKGIFDFKSGVGGQPYRLAPEIEAGAGVRASLVRWRTARARAAGEAG